MFFVFTSLKNLCEHFLKIVTLNCLVRLPYFTKPRPKAHKQTYRVAASIFIRVHLKFSYNILIRNDFGINCRIFVDSIFNVFLCLFCWLYYVAYAQRNMFLFTYRQSLQTRKGFMCVYCSVRQQ